MLLYCLYSVHSPYIQFISFRHNYPYCCYLWLSVVPSFPFDLVCSSQEPLSLSRLVLFLKKPSPLWFLILGSALAIAALPLLLYSLLHPLAGFLTPFAYRSSVYLSLARALSSRLFSSLFAVLLKEPAPFDAARLMEYSLEYSSYSFSGESDSSCSLLFGGESLFLGEELRQT